MPRPPRFRGMVAIATTAVLARSGLPACIARTHVPILGDLLSEFDFSQASLPPLVLPEHPRPGPASIAGT
jgi:hypothetical protein